MRLIPIAEILKMDIGEKIPSLKGKIKSIYDQTSGEKNGKPWSIQTVILTDPSNPKIEVRVKIWNHDAIPTGWKGKTLYIESAQGQKGLKHVDLTQDVYKWKEGQPIKKQIEIQDEAVVGLDDGAARGEEAPPQERAPAEETPQRGTQRQQQAAPPAKPNGPVPGSFDDQVNCVIKAKFALGKAINGLELCVDAALHLNERAVAKHKDFPGFRPEDIRAIAIHLSIDLGKGDLRDGLPHGSMDKIFEAIESRKASQQSKTTGKQ